MAVRKDGGWSWLVCVGTFTMMFLETGMVKALGVLLPVLRQQFDTKTWVIGLIISLVPGFGAVSCPLAGGLSKLFSARWIVMIFSLLASIGLVLGSISPSVAMLSVCFVMHGLAFGAEAIVSGELAQYFDDYFSIANAISYVGGSVGVIVLPLLTQFFLDVYGWRGCMLLLAGLSFHCIISGAVLRPITSPPDSAEEGLLELQKLHDNGVSTKRHQENGDLLELQRLHDNGVSTSKPHQENEKLLDSGVSKSRQDNGRTFSIAIARMIYILDLDLYCDPNFLTRMVICFGDGYCFTGWLIYLVPFAMENGVAPYDAAALATCGGIGNLLGHGMFSLVVRFASNEFILYSTAIASCIAFVLYPVFSSCLYTYAGLAVCSAVVGAANGIGDLANCQITKETIDLDKMTNAFMWMFVAYSSESVVSGFLSGWIYDQCGSYTVSFLILGATALLSVSPQPFLDNSYIRTPNRSRYSSIWDD